MPSVLVMNKENKVVSQDGTIAQPPVASMSLSQLYDSTIASKDKLFCV